MDRPQEQKPGIYTFPSEYTKGLYVEENETESRFNQQLYFWQDILYNCSFDNNLS